MPDRETVIIRCESTRGMSPARALAHMKSIQEAAQRVIDDDPGAPRFVMIPHDMDVVYRSRVKAHDEKEINDINEMLIELGLDVQIVRGDDMVLGAINRPVGT